MWGTPTIKKDARRVTVNKDVVERDRGWRWGGIAARDAKGFGLESESG